MADPVGEGDAAAAPLLSRLPAAAIAPALAGLLLRGHDTVQAAREAFGVHYPPYARYGGGAAMARQVAALDVADTLAVQDALPGLRVPARVVWGTADPFQRLAYGERFARDLGTTVRWIESGRHFTPEDSAAVLADSITGLAAEAGTSG